LVPASVAQRGFQQAHADVKPWGFPDGSVSRGEAGILVDGDASGALNDPRDRRSA
jgi:hypothetical protein